MKTITQAVIIDKREYEDLPDEILDAIMRAAYGNGGFKAISRETGRVMDELTLRGLLRRHIDEVLNPDERA